MTTQNDDTGIIQVILERFEKQRLPRMIEIKQRLDQGNTLNEFELEYLSEAVHDANDVGVNFIKLLEDKLFSSVVYFF